MLAFTKPALLIICCLHFTLSISAKTSFFSSKINFEGGQLSRFSSTVAVAGNKVSFNSNNYKIYYFNKQTGKELWSYYAIKKTNIPSIPYGNKLITGMYVNEEPKAQLLHIESRKLLQTLPIEPLPGMPVFKNNIMYGTAISSGGQLFAYDFAYNKIFSKQFVAHGGEVQPYFYKNKIVANVKVNNWFEGNYAGKLLDNACYTKAILSDEYIKCMRHATCVTHADRDITTAYIQKNFGGNADVVLYDATGIIVFGNHKKRIHTADIQQISGAENNLGIGDIIQSGTQKIWLDASGLLIIYDYKIDTVLHHPDLVKWQQHHIIKDG